MPAENSAGQVAAKESLFFNSIQLLLTRGGEARCALG